MVIQTSNTRSIIEAVIETNEHPKILTVGGHIIKPEHVNIITNKLTSHIDNLLRLKIVLENNDKCSNPDEQKPVIDYFEFTETGDHISEYKHVELNFYDEFDYKTNILRVEEIV